jgi:hypothetical protein
VFHIERALLRRSRFANVPPFAHFHAIFGMLARCAGLKLANTCHITNVCSCTA